MFEEELCRRFGELFAPNIIKEFNKLTQEGINPTLDEAYFISRFISGLD